MTYNRKKVERSIKMDPTFKATGEKIGVLKVTLEQTEANIRTINTKYDTSQLRRELLEHMVWPAQLKHDILDLYRELPGGKVGLNGGLAPVSHTKTSSEAETEVESKVDGPKEWK
jgi:hypothetical protein